MPPTASAAQFLPPPEGAPFGPWALYVSVQGDGYVERAIMLSATVGDIPVQMIYQSPGGDGFIGFLATVPPDGAVLSIGYEQLAPTSIVYQSPPVA
jgi:hypothetical protein